VDDCVYVVLLTVRHT